MRRRGRRNQSSTIAMSAAGIARAARTVSICVSMPVPLQLLRTGAAVGRRRSSFAPDFQHCQKGLLRNLDLPYLLHALFALFLFFEQLALARNITAVALCQHVLEQRLYRSAPDHVTVHRGLDRRR